MTLKAVDAPLKTTGWTGSHKQMEIRASFSDMQRSEVTMPFISDGAVLNTEVLVSCNAQHIICLISTHTGKTAAVHKK